MRPPREEREVRLSVVRTAQSLIRSLAAQHFMKNDTHREHVAFDIAVEIGISEIRGHVVERAPNVPCRRCSRPTGLLGYLEVDELHAAVSAEENVARLDVAVDDSGTGRIDQTLYRQPCYADRFVNVKSGWIASESILERLAVKELLDYYVYVVECALLGEAPMVFDDARMIQVGEFPRPLFEFSPLRLPFVLDRHDLERNDCANRNKPMPVLIADSLVHSALASRSRLDFRKDSESANYLVLQR